MKVMPTQRDTATVIALSEDYVSMEGFSVFYRFLANGDGGKDRFLITARLGEEECQVGCGLDLELAWSFYKRIVAGGVTPISLRDIWEDFFYEYGNVKKSLYNSENL